MSFDETKFPISPIAICVLAFGILDFSVRVYVTTYGFELQPPYYIGFSGAIFSLAIYALFAYAAQRYHKFIIQCKQKIDFTDHKKSIVSIICYTGAFLAALSFLFATYRYLQIVGFRIDLNTPEFASTPLLTLWDTIIWFTFGYVIQSLADLHSAIIKNDRVADA